MVSEWSGETEYGNIILWKKGKISRIMILKYLSKQWIGGCLYANFKKRLEVV